MTTDDELRALLHEVKAGALKLVLSLPEREPVAELRLALHEMELYCTLIRRALKGDDDDDDTPN